MDCPCTSIFISVFISAVPFIGKPVLSAKYVVPSNVPVMVIGIPCTVAPSAVFSVPVALMVAILPLTDESVYVPSVVIGIPLLVVFNDAVQLSPIATGFLG